MSQGPLSFSLTAEENAVACEVAAFYRKSTPLVNFRVIIVASSRHPPALAGHFDL